jgi:small subunit ribosomal protein S11
MGKKKVIQPQGETPAAAPADAKAPAPTAVAAPKVSKKMRSLTSGRAYINATYNNTVVSVTDPQGNVLAWATAGSLGFNGPKKATPFASSKIVAVIAEKLKAMGVTDLEVFVRGIGGGRDSAIRSLANQGFQLTSLHDVTPMPHNGPKPKKARRV